MCVSVLYVSVWIMLCYCAIDIVTVTQSDRIEGLWYTLMLRIPDVHLYQEVLMYTYVESSDTHLYQDTQPKKSCVKESWYAPDVCLFVVHAL